ncbi:MAG: response regulator [Syntrophaceae bacterium]
MKKILVVDDNYENRYILEKLLETNNLNVTVAQNGKDALEKAHSNPPDLIISDILMPIMDGYTLCRIWKSDEQLKKIPFIFYTATYTDPKDEEFALKLGAERFIIKPQEPLVFMKLLKEFIAEEEYAIDFPDKQPLGSEMEFFRQYNEILFNKLEKKMFDLEYANERLNREVDEHKRTEEKLLKLTQAIEASPVSIMLTDLNANIEYVNPKFTQVSGYSYQEIIGQNPRILKSGEMSPDIYKELWRTITSGNIWHGELCNKKKNGEFCWEYVTVSPIKNSKGVITNFMANLEDVSEWRKLEEQLRQSQKLEGIGQLAGGIAHDFNNILTAIIGYAHLSILHMSNDDPVRLYIQRILESSEKAVALVQSLLAFSRKQTTNLANINLNDLICNFQKFLLHILREDIEMKTVCTDKVLSLMADKGQIEQVIMNLVTNARDAMPKGGNLVIGTNLVEINEEFIKVHGYGEPGQYAEISVKDTGIGMNQITKEKIFEPFFTTKEQGKGTGLGLSMVYGIVKKHNGYINVYSEVGKGTLFSILLPTAGSVIEMEDKKIVQEPPVKGGTETILIAEDDSAIRELISSTLINYGYTVISAADGDEAIYKFIENKEKIELAILDGIMPKKSGMDVFNEIQIIKPGIKIILMSGYPADILNFQDIADKKLIYLPKPVMFSQILKKARELLDT